MNFTASLSEYMWFVLPLKMNRQIQKDVINIYISSIYGVHLSQRDDDKKSKFSKHVHTVELGLGP